MSLSVNTSRTLNNSKPSSSSSFYSLSASSTSNSNTAQNQLLNACKNMDSLKRKDTQNQLLREYSTLSSADKIKVKEETKIYIEILIKKMGYNSSLAAWAVKYINEQLEKAETAAALNINNTRKSI